MNRNYRSICNMAIVVAIMMMALAGCLQGRVSNENASSVEDLKADSIIMATIHSSEFDRAYFLIDSFLDRGDILPMRADLRRAMTHFFKGEERESFEYMEKICERCSQTGEEPWVYTTAAIMLSSYYQANEKYEEALRIAVPAVEKLEQSTVVSPLHLCLILTTIGNCQMNLKLKDDAEKNYEKAYLYTKKYQAETKDQSTHDILSMMANIVSEYSNQGMPDIHQKWIERADSVLTWYKSLPDVDSVDIDEMEGKLSNEKASLFIALGEKAKAAKAFEQFLKTDYSKSDQGRINSTFYLEAIGKYAEAADIYQDLDRMMDEWGLETNLDAIKNYLFPKFRYNYLAGRKDTALAVAMEIDSLIGPAITAQKESAAAELATIYETQKKEAQIAQQQATLSQQRLWGVMIGLGLIALFLTLYLFYYRHSQKRLARLRAAQERIEGELQIARDIQMGMIPSTFPQREGLDMFASMTPAKEVGGDLYGYLLQGDKLYVAVGDVSGKGVPASLFMAQATRLFQTMAKQGMMPAEICTHMNDALSGDDNENGMFVTFWLGLVDLQTGHLNYCNAGHNPPIIGGGDHHGDFLEMIPNAPIGLWPDLEYESEEIDTIKGRPLFIYTDGLNEAENAQQEQFGDSRLLDILRNTHFDTAQQVIDVLKVEVEAHRAGAEPNDDLTMMCLRVG